MTFAIKVSHDAQFGVSSRQSVDDTLSSLGSRICPNLLSLKEYKSA